MFARFTSRGKAPRPWIASTKKKMFVASAWLEGGKKLNYIIKATTRGGAMRVIAKNQGVSLSGAMTRGKETYVPKEKFYIKFQ